jgi:hypothetical protein
MNKDTKMVDKTYFPFQECFVSSFRLCLLQCKLNCEMTNMHIPLWKALATLKEQLQGPMMGAFGRGV